MTVSKKKEIELSLRILVDDSVDDANLASAVEIQLRPISDISEAFGKINIRTIARDQSILLPTAELPDAGGYSSKLWEKATC